MLYTLKSLKPATGGFFVAPMTSSLRCSLAGTPYLLLKAASGWVLKKDGQFNLFGGIDEIKPKLKRRGTKNSPGQMSLFDMGGGDAGDMAGLIPIAPPTTLQPKRSSSSNQRRAPKGGGYYRNKETGQTQFFAGGKFIPANFEDGEQPKSEMLGGLPPLQYNVPTKEPAIASASVPTSVAVDEPPTVKPAVKPANEPASPPVSTAEELSAEQIEKEKAEEYRQKLIENARRNRERETDTVVLSDDTATGGVKAVQLGQYAYSQQNPQYWASINKQIASNLKRGESLSTSIKSALMIGSIYGDGFRTKLEDPKPVKKPKLPVGVESLTFLSNAIDDLEEQEVHRILDIPDPNEQMKEIGRKSLESRNESSGYDDGMTRKRAYLQLGNAIFLKQFESTPKEGDRKTVNGHTYELVDGRWHRVDEDPTAETITPVAETVEMPLGEDIDYEAVRGEKTRVKFNEQVKQLLAEKPDGPYTDEEKELLSKYSGKGGFRDNEASLNEYYTRADVAKFTADLLYQHGFQSGTVLEPSCATGVFLNEFKDRGDVLPVGVEMDPTSSAVAANLNPNAHVAVGTRFERFLLNNPEFSPDAVTGNIPFGPRTIGDDTDLEAAKHKRDELNTCESYFLHEAMDRLKPGGVMSIIVPHGVMTGAKHQELRQKLTKMGRLVGGYRLPSDAFKHSGTETITDVLVMQKHPDDVLNAIASGDAAVIQATADDSFVGGAYFKEHPEHVLGTEREITGFRKGFTIDGNTTEAIKNAPPLAPSVTYEGLTIQPADQPQIGDTKYIDGRLYKLDGNPPRWHLVQDEEPIPTDVDSAAYGVDSLESAHSRLEDAGERLKIEPDQLDAYIRMARGKLPDADVAMMRDAARAVERAKSDTERDKISHAMLLAGHLKLMHASGDSDARALEQGLGMLQTYREKWGNPTTDRSLKAIANDFPQIFTLQGAFLDDGTISDSFANPDALKKQEERLMDTAGGAAAEAYRAYAGNPVTLDQVREFYDSELSDDDLKAQVLADPAIGYSEGQFMPMNSLIKGNGYSLIDKFQEELTNAPFDSAESRKLDEQIALVRSKMELRPLENIEVSLWNVGSWIPHEALNDYLKDNGIALQIEPNPDGSRKFKKSYYKEDKKNKLNQGIFWEVNGEKYRSNIVAAEGYPMKDAIADLEADFKDWLGGTEYRFQIEDKYNRAFNAQLPSEYSGDFLDIKGFNQIQGERQLHDYQNSTIRQMADQGRGIVSLGVGLGKTATAIGLAAHLKETGRAQKPTFVVPKSVLANWVKELKFWSPNANVMILGMTQQYWADNSEAYELPGFQIAMQGEKQQFFKDGSPVLRPVGDLKGMILATEGTGKSQKYKRDEQGNYLLYSEDDVDLKASEREYTAISEEDLKRQSTPLYVGGAGLPERDRKGNYVLYSDDDFHRENPITLSESDLKKRGILAMGTDDRETKERKMQQIAQNSFDVVLMSEPVCQRINLSPEKYLEYMNGVVGKHLNPDSADTKTAIVTAKKKLAEDGPKDGDVRTNGAGNLEEFKEGRWHRLESEQDLKRGYARLKQEESLKGQILDRDLERTKNIYWEDLGIDCLIADEAHHYKNLWAPFRSGSDIAFVSSATSKRSLDFYFKSQFTRETNNGQNTFLLTATPTTNNPLEAFNMLQHVCPDELEARGISNIDHFLDHFGRIETVDTIGVDLEAKRKEGLVGFRSLKDLRKIFNQYCRMESAKSLQEKGNTSFRQPEELANVHQIEMSAKQKEIYSTLKARAKEIMEAAKRGEEREEGDDHIFSVISDMDKVALDINYYDETHSEHGVSADLKTERDKRSPKIEATARNVMASRAANGGKQIVFCDSVQMHEALKQQLVAAEYPENEIAIVNANTMPNATDRQKISQSYNSGRITLVVGNTATMGEGLNFNIGTTDIHHLNTPWTPAAIEQRNGRGIRQGNEIDSVSTHYYTANGSFDAYRRDTNTRKAGWIGELWNGDSDEADNANAGAGSEDLIYLLDDDPLAAKRRAESSKEAARQREKEKQEKRAMAQFKTLQAKKGLYKSMGPNERKSEKGIALEKDIERAIKTLSANEFFNFKAMLDGTDPVYIHRDGSLLAVGQHIQDGDGTVHRVTAVDLKQKRIKTVEVGGPSYNPNSYSIGKEHDKSLNHFASTKEEKGEKQGKVKGRGWDKRQAERQFYMPIEYNDDIHRLRILENSVDYGKIRAMPPEWIDQHRDKVIEAIGKTYSNKFVYTEAGSDEIKVGTGYHIPKDAKILLPHDGIEPVLRAIAQSEIDNPGYNFEGTQLKTALSTMTGEQISSFSDRIAAIKEEIGPKAGETRTNSAGNQEEFRDGRWHRVSEDQPVTTTSSADQPAASSNSEFTEPKTEGSSAALSHVPAQYHDRIKAVAETALDQTPDDARRKVMREIIAVANEAGNQQIAEFKLEATDNLIEEVKQDKKKKERASKVMSESHPDPLGAIHTALLHLAENDPDRAGERNEAGFNGVDGDFGHSLAGQIQSGKQLTPNQYKAAHKMLIKYHKQVGLMPSHEDLAQAIEALPAPTMASNTNMKHRGDYIGVSFPYKRDNYDERYRAVRSIPGSEWHKPSGEWKVPFHAFNKLMQHPAMRDFNVDDKLFDEDRIFQEKQMSQLPTDRPPTQKELAEHLADVVNADESREYLLNPYTDRKGYMRLYVNRRDGKKTDMGFIEIDPSGNVRDKSALALNDPIMQTITSIRPLSKSAQYQIGNVAYALGMLPTGQWALIKKHGYAV